MPSLSPDAPSCAPLVQEATRLMLQLDPEPSHARQVCRLAMLLFDEWRALHQLGPGERAVLEAAALLHDVGWSVSGSQHHKHSSRLILEHSWECASGLQVLQIAAVARYHRKAHPKPSHGVYSQLDAVVREAVRRLAAILRVADGLDRSHENRVVGIRAQQRPDHCVLHLQGIGSCSAELWAADRKRGLWEETFGLRLELCLEPPGGEGNPEGSVLPG